MSFILDALKKSETDRQRQTGPALFEVKVAPPKPGFPVWAIAIVALLAVNMVIVGWLLFRRSSHGEDAAQNAQQPSAARQSAPTRGPDGAASQTAGPGQNNSGQHGVPSSGAMGQSPASRGQLEESSNQMPGRGQNEPTLGGAGGTGRGDGAGAGTMGRGDSTGIGSAAGGGNGAGGGHGIEGAPDAGNGAGGVGSGGAIAGGAGGTNSLGAGGANNGNGSGRTDGTGPGGAGAGGTGVGAAGNGLGRTGGAGGTDVGGAGGTGAGGTGVGGAGNGYAGNGANAAGASAEAGAEGGANPDDYAPAQDAGAPIFKGHVRRGTESGLMLYQDLAVTNGANLPELRLDMHVYDAKPQNRFALINMRKVQEGQMVKDGVKVEAITPDGVVLSHNGTKFLLPRE